MTEPMPAVALLFDDAGLVVHLRVALQERGVRIVHEGPPAGADRELLRGCGAEVVVVNLDEADEGGLDALYEALDGGGLRVVFNDAAASRGLDGWDRARWARHLAVKVLAAGELEPPRPPGALPVEVRPALASAPPQAVSAFAPPAQSETLAAELEALLAAEALAAGSPTLVGGWFEPEPAVAGIGSGAAAAARPSLPAAGLGEASRSAPADATAPEPAALHRQGVGPEPAGGGGGSAGVPPGAPHGRRDPAPAAFAGMDEGLSLAPLEAAPAPAPPVRRETVEAPSWSLLGEGEGEEPAAAAGSGIDKLSAADYLAPIAPAAEDDGEPPGPGLELVSLEEALAPQARQASHEMLLSEPVAAVRRLVLLGVPGDGHGLAAVGEFLAALPVDLRLPVLLIADRRSRPAGEVAERLKAAGGRSVGVAAAGVRLRAGEVLVVPPGWLARPSRDSRLALHALEGDAALAPVDAGFAAAAEVFGRDLLAVVFAGLAGDGLVGARAVRARGGRVWAQAAAADDPAAEVAAAGLALCSDTPPRLAARLGDDDVWKDGE